MQGDVTYDIGDFIAKKWKVTPYPAACTSVEGLCVLTLALGSALPQKIPKKAILLVSKSGKKQPACYDSGSDDSD